jgi:uncharacterized protein YajQ (UPF0234 family)
MLSEQELRETIDNAERELASRFEVTQVQTAKDGRLAQIRMAAAAVERTDKELANLEQKIAEAALDLDNRIKERFLSRNYLSLSANTPVNNTAQVWISLKDALLRKMEERGKFSALHADLVRVEESSKPKV